MTEFERMEKFKSIFKGLSLFKDPTTVDTLKNVGFFLAPPQSTITDSIGNYQLSKALHL